MTLTKQKIDNLLTVGYNLNLDNKTVTLDVDTLRQIVNKAYQYGLNRHVIGIQYKDNK